MRKRVPFSTVFLFIAIQSALLIDVTHSRTGPDPAGNPHTIPDPQGTPRIFPLRNDDQAARQLLAAGHLQEAQDEYLRLLLFRPPDDSKALQGLVTTRRRMANGNLAILRQQANTYKRALTSGIETNEHYTQESLRFIYVATLMAAARVEGERSANAAARPSAGPPERVPGRNAQGTSGAASPGSANNSTSGSPRVVSHVTTPRVTPVGVSSLGQPQSRAGTVGPVSLRPMAPPATPTRNWPASAAVIESPSPEGDHARASATISPGPRANRLRSVGTLRAVDCQRQTLGVDTSRGGQEVSATSNTFIAAGTEKVTQFCSLQRFVGSRVRVWGWSVGARHTAWLIYVLVPSAQMTLNRTGGQEADPFALSAGEPDPMTTTDPIGNDPKSAPSERIGIIATKIDNAAIVVSPDGVHPIVITAGTRIVGLRTTFGAVTRLDSVRASGRLTQTGTLIADLIEVTNIPSRRQVQQVNALGTGSLIFGDLSRIQSIVGTGSVANGAAVNGGGSMNNGSTSVIAGTSVSGGGPSVNAGASVNSGASVSSSGPSVNAGASVNGGASVSSGATSGSAGASVNGGASVSGGGTKGGASVNGGASVSGGGTKGGASVNAGASVNSGGVSVGGGLSIGGVGGVSGSGGGSGSGGASGRDGGAGQH